MKTIKWWCLEQGHISSAKGKAFAYKDMTQRPTDSDWLAFPLVSEGETMLPRSNRWLAWG